MNKEWVKLGAIKKSDKGSQYIALGIKGKYKPCTVEVTVKDSTGKVIATATNPNITIQNPRKRKGITEEDAAKIPEFLLAELSLPPVKE